MYTRNIKTGTLAASPSRPGPGHRPKGILPPGDAAFLFAPFVRPPVSVSVCVCLSVYVSVYLSVYLFVLLENCGCVQVVKSEVLFNGRP